MAASLEEFSALRVNVDEVMFMPSLDAPRDRPYPFVYFITIRNDSEQVVTIRGRKWVIREDCGENVVVEGEGVVGKFPRLAPGEEFSYNSYHVVKGDSVADGAFLAETEGGGGIFARIPRFEMRVPPAGS